MTNKKSRMSFRLVQISVNLNDLVGRNSPNYLCIISPNSVAFGADYVKVVTHTFCGKNVGQII